MANYVSKHTGSQIDTAVENVGVLEGKVTTLSEEITQNHEKLSDEIKSLRAGVFDEVTIKSQTVIFKPSEGSPINATSLIASEEGVTQVQLTHSNKNLARFKPAISSNGWTLSFPGLSEARIEGTGIADKFIDIAEYTMRSTQAMLTVTMPAGMTFEYRVNGVWTAYIENGNTAIINGSVGDVISGYFKALSGTTVSGAVTVQLEIGTVATEYVPAVETVYTVDLPHTVYNGSYKWADGTLVDSDTGETVTLTAYTILAHSGTNALWSNAGETSVAYQRPASQGGGGEGGGTYLDYRAFNLEVMYLTGDTMLMNKDNAVVLKIKFKDIDAWAKIKWQGSSSLAYPEKNYTIVIYADEACTIPLDVVIVEGWGAQNKYCAKANWIDFSQSRNLGCAKLWGQICASRGNDPLADCPNYGAVDGFPIVIVINDEFMGVYTLNIPKDGWMANMPAAGATQEAILCADVTGIAPTRFKGAATLDGDFEVEYITNEDSTDWAKNSLNTLINACVASNGSDLDTTIAPMLDWNRAIDYYIFTVLIRGDDMIDKNYLLIKRENNPWLFGGYDMDCTFGLYWDGSKWVEANAWTTFAQVAEKHRVMELIRTYKKAELVARYEELRGSVLSEDNVALTFLNFAGQIPLALLNEDNRRWPTKPNTNVNNVQQIFDWYRRRCIVIDAEIAKLKS